MAYLSRLSLTNFRNFAELEVDLPLGVVGGGTALATQREALALLGVTPREDDPGWASMRMAEILGATVLAGELSLMAAFTSGDLARAHERLGRGQPDEH